MKPKSHMLISFKLFIRRSKVPLREQKAPTTAPEVGPGTYRGAEKPTFTTKYPDRNSPSFLKDRDFDIEVLGAQYDTLYPRHFLGPGIRTDLHNTSHATELKAPAFTDRLPTEKKIREASLFQDASKHTHISAIAMDKIQKIHPRLYRKLNK